MENVMRAIEFYIWVWKHTPALSRGELEDKKQVLV
jgi:hypothetical protein